MQNYSPDLHGYACAKCGTTAPYRVEYYRRSADWILTTTTMTTWKAEYQVMFDVEHDAPETGLLEWLIWRCRCGYAFETRCADA